MDSFKCRRIFKYFKIGSNFHAFLVGTVEKEHTLGNYWTNFCWI